MLFNANKTNRFVLSIFANLVATLVSLGVSFFLTPYLINNLGKEAYSFFPLANSLLSYIDILSIALNSMASRFITVSLVSGKEKQAKCYFSTVFFSNLFLSLLLIVPMLFVIYRIDSIFNIPYSILIDVRYLFILMFSALLIQLLFSVFGVATFAMERMDLSAFQSIGLNVLRVILYVTFFNVLPISISIMGIVSFLLAIYTSFTNYFFSSRLLPDYRIKKKLFDLLCLKELLSSGIWNSLNYLGMVLLQMMIIILANTLISSSASGDISIVQIFPNLMTTVISAVFGVLLPKIANVYASYDNHYTIFMVKYLQKVLGVFSTVPAIMIILFGKHFFRLWTPNENADYLYIILIIQIIPLFVHSTMWTVYGLNMINNKVKWPAIVFIILGCLNVILSIVIVRHTGLGVIGIVLISTIISIVYYLFFLPMYTSINIGTDISTFYPHILKSIGFAVLICLISVKHINLLAINSWVSFFVYSVIVGIVLELLYCIVIFNKDEKKSIILYIRNNLLGE